MQDPPQLREERALDRRNHISCVLTFAVAAAVIVLVTLLPFGIFQAQSKPTWALLLAVLGGLVITLGLGIGAMILVLRISSWALEGERQRQRRGAEVLQRTLPNVAAESPLAAQKLSAAELGKQLVRLFLFVVAISIAFVAVELVVRWLWRDAPGFTSLVIVFALVAALLYLQPTLLNIQPLARDKARPPRGARLAAGFIYLLVIFVPTLAVIPLIELFHLPGPLVAVLALALCTGVFMAANMIYALAPMVWIQAAVKRCDYAGALTRAQRAAEFSFMPGFYRNMEGVILLWAGRYGEARTTFEQSIGETRSSGMGAGSAALENVGCALAWQGKFDEAIPMFEGSIAISPSQVMVYSDLAEAYVRHRSNLPRALELTERAIKNQQQAGIESRLLAKHQAGQILATRAWALAAAGQRAEAEQTLGRAFAAADKSFTPVLAGIYWRAGETMLALGERQKADEYFAEGKRLDSRGHYGRLCVQALVG